MLFTSPLLLCIFLPVFLAAYYLSGSGARNGVALGFSLFFYFWGAPAFLPIVLVAGAGNYYLSGVLARSQNRRTRRGLVALAIGVHLGILLYYKYLHFLVDQLASLLQFTGHTLPISLPEIILPLGVSFITFEQISYLLDVYRGDCRPAQRLSDYYLFLLFFPHSIAGPIFRWKDLQGQIRGRTLEDSQISTGFVRFMYGLGKKALVANYVGYPADRIFALPLEQVGFSVAWLAAIAYSLEIYFDFSAYSDMAIGIGHMTGFEFKENFSFPYLSRSITEFWERWHISLTSWFRTYLYIPLGGNRISSRRTYVNILIVFALSGLWHGSRWNFLLWGAYYGLLIVGERFLNIGTRAGSQPILGWRALPTMFLVMVGWVIFRAGDLQQVQVFLKAMAGLSPHPASLTTPEALLLPYRCALSLVLALGMIPLEPWIYRGLRSGMRPAIRWATVTALFVFSLAALANSTYNPFIYFRF